MQKRLEYLLPEGAVFMHQSRKEQGVERASRRLLHTDRREAIVMSRLEEQVETAEEFLAFPSNRREPGGRM